MPVPAEQNPSFDAYAHPERLVSTEWLGANLGAPGLVVVESDEDVLLYDVGHIPGAVKIDWHLDLNDQVTRDYLDGEAFAELMSRKGIGRDDTIVVYGDKSNWWAAYALWVFTLFGHEDVRLLDGGRDAWLAENRETTLDVPDRPRTEYPVVQRDDSQIRAYQEDRLLRQIRYCYDNSAFYRERFEQVGVQVDNIRSLDDYYRMPILMDKEQ